MVGVSYITIPFLTKPEIPDVNGRVYKKEGIDSIFLKRGYLPWKEEDRKIIPIRFFDSSESYRRFISDNGFDCTDKSRMIKYTTGIASELNACNDIARHARIIFMNDRYHLTIPTDSTMLEIDKTYFQNCDVYLVYSADTSSTKDGDGCLILNDILFMDIMPRR